MLDITPNNDKLNLVLCKKRHREKPHGHKQVETVFDINGYSLHYWFDWRNARLTSTLCSGDTHHVRVDSFIHINRSDLPAPIKLRPCLQILQKKMLR